MGERFVDVLLKGMKRFVAAFGTYWRRRFAPPVPPADPK